VANVLHQVAEGVARIVIARPEAMNAIDEQTHDELRAAWTAACRDPEVKVILFSGSGGKAFAAGADLRKLQHMSMVEVLDRDLRKLWIDVEQGPKVCIAAIDGFCIGAGLELAIACDLRIATTRSRFGITDANLGFTPGGGALYRLPKLIGKGKTKEMFLTGELVPAEEAYRVGLVNRIASPEEFEGAVAALTGTVASRAPLALRLGKMLVDVGAESSLFVSSAIEAVTQSLLCTTADKAEGIDAFFSKRPPEFKGR
jgi:enoyl-CoA hydratase